jgi:dTDP-4-dehydrorhamnose reductase
MKILVTGSNGLLGQKLTELILTNGKHELIATSRGEDRLNAGGYTYFSMDTSHLDQILEVVQATKPDVIIHTAAMTNVDQCELNQVDCFIQNVTATQNVIQAANAVGAFLVHLSTDFIFDGQEGPYIEESKANPVSYYGETKLEAEKLVIDQAKQWAIVRTVLVFGIVKDMSRSNIVLWVKDSLTAGKQIKVVDDQWRTPTLAEDLAMGCLLIAEQKAGGIWNISGEEMLTPYDMAIATCEYFELDKSLIERVDSTIFTQPAKRPPRTGFIIKKAKKQLGYEPHSFREGLKLLSEQLSSR